MKRSSANGSVEDDVAIARAHLPHLPRSNPRGIRGADYHISVLGRNDEHHPNAHIEYAKHLVARNVSRFLNLGEQRWNIPDVLTAALNWLSAASLIAGMVFLALFVFFNLP